MITPRKMIDIETNDFAPSTTTNRALVAQKNSKQILLEIEHVSFSQILWFVKKLYLYLMFIIFRCTYRY